MRKKAEIKLNINERKINYYYRVKLAAPFIGFMLR